MTRRSLIPHRKPRTRRERLLARFHAVRGDARRLVRRQRGRLRHRTEHARTQKLFLHLGHKPQLRAGLVVGRTRRARPHLRHPKP